MVDSFFIDPAKKRKGKKLAITRNKKSMKKSAVSEPDDDEITSESEVSMHDLSSSEDSEDEELNETEADKRRRLAKEYLESLKDELADGEEVFDAKDLDREIISRRLKEDVAEQEGRVYRFLNRSYNFSQLNKDNGKVRSHKMKPYGITGVALHYPFAYTSSKDIYLSKWDISNPNSIRLVKFVRGDRREKKKNGAHNDPYMGHFDEILCIAVNHNGTYVATGGKDKRIVVWSTEKLAPLKVMETKDRKGDVLRMTFRRNTNELYVSCADLKVRTYNLDQLTQVETLFGHQDEVCDISALGLERCITVGSRDRTVMLWKINEESRLIFRGGDSRNQPGQVMEGSIECCCMIDDQLFVTGSDNGSVCLWSTNKKRPIHVKRETHGKDEPMAKSQYTAEMEEMEKIGVPEPLPRFITSIHAIPYSNVFITGSWSGQLKLWELNEDLRSFDPLATVDHVPGIVNQITTTEVDGKLIIVAAVAKEMRRGRWIKQKSGVNGIVIVSVYK